MIPCRHLRPALRALIPTLAMLLVACGGARVPETRTTPAEPGGVTLDERATILAAEDRRAAGAVPAAALASDKAELRALAVRALGRIGDAAGLDSVRTAAGDPEPRVRVEAAWALGRMGAPSTLDLLASLARDDDRDVRVAGAGALGLLGTPEAAAPLAALLADDDSLVRAAAALACRGFSDPACDVEGLLRLSASGDPLAVVAATAGLSRLGQTAPSLTDERVDRAVRDRARARLVELSRSETSLVRLFVGRGLVGPVSTAQVDVFARLLGDSNLQVRLSAIRSLAVSGNPFLTDMEALLGDAHTHVKAMAMEGMGTIGGERATGLLVREIINRRSPWLRERATLALSHADRELASRTAHGTSRDPVPRVRLAAAAALAGSEAPEARLALDRLRIDPDPRIRAAVVGAVAGARGPIAEPLADFVSDPEPVVRAAVAGVAGQRLGGLASSEDDRANALGVLRRLMDGATTDAGPLVRRAVVLAAGRLPDDPRARELLEQGLEDADRRVRLAAASALGRPAGPAAGLPEETYLEIARWASRPRAAIVTVQRPGYVPGRFTLRLDVEGTPLTSWRFAELAAAGFYDGTEISRVIPDARVETGPPNGDTSTGPADGLRDELLPDGFARGTVGMLSPGRDQGDGHWFVSLSDRPFIVDRFTRFASVVQNLAGVVGRLHGGDRIVSVEVYEGDGSEPLPPL
jgi:HEAT repeat protein/cyclophilin family peptidyl-prolyl cis-trans isomerase